MSKLCSALLASAASAALFCTEDATAQEMSTDPSNIGGAGYFGETVPVRRDALEVSLGAGYMQGFGDLQEGTAVGDTAAAGVNLELGLAWRLSPRWAVGVSGGYQTYGTGDALTDDAGPNGATARLEARYHFSPWSRLDPWLELGTGYRHLCECDQPGENAYLNGLELANLSAGLDWRVGSQLALAPTVGAGLDMFLWDRTEAIDEPRLSTFVFAGIQARFGVGGSEDRSDGSLLAGY